MPRAFRSALELRRRLLLHSDATIDALMSVAPYFRIKRAAAVKMLRKIERAVSHGAAWESVWV
jgi:hypothetical protein